MGADVHAFGVNNLKWTDDSGKIGYCPKRIERKKKNDDSPKLFSVEGKKMRIKADAIEIHSQKRYLSHLLPFE